MNEEQRHPPIDPELEARIVAAVLGEASDFEREELERLIEQRPELAAFRAEIQGVHALMQDIATDDPVPEDQDWKLAAEKRDALLAVFSGEATKLAKTSLPAASKQIMGGRTRTLLKVIAALAAVLCLAVIYAGTSITARRVRSLASDSPLIGLAEEAVKSARSELAADVAADAPVAANGSMNDGAVAMSVDEADFSRATELAIRLPDAKRDSLEALSVLRSTLGEKSSPPSPYYLQDDVQYSPAGPEFSLSEEVETAGQSSVALGLRGKADAADAGVTITEPAAELAMPAELSDLATIPQAGEGTVAGGYVDNYAKRESFGVVPGFGRESIPTPEAGAYSMPENKPSSGAMAEDLYSDPVPSRGYQGQPGQQRENQQQENQQQAGQKWAAAGRDVAESAEGQANQAWSYGMPAQGGPAPSGQMMLGGALSGPQVADAELGFQELPQLAAEPSGARPEGRLPQSEFDSEMQPSPPPAPVALDALTESEVPAKESADDFAANSVQLPTFSFDAKTRGLAQGLAEDKPASETPASETPASETPASETEERVISGQLADKDAKASFENMPTDGLQITLEQLGKPAASTATAGQPATPMQADRDLQQKLSRLDPRFRFARPDENGRMDQSGAEVALGELKMLKGKAIRGESADWFGDESLSLSEGWQEKDQVTQFFRRKVLFDVAKQATPAGMDEVNAGEEAFSTFSLHVSDVSFKLARAALAAGQWPEAAKVRIEEFVNAFDYGDPLPGRNAKVACRMEQAVHPFLQQRNLLRVSMRTAAAGRASSTPLRLTLLLDHSGSMERIDRQETVRRAFALLAGQLHASDQVTLISFARQPRLIADKVNGSQAAQLVQLVDQLPSEGGTNIEAALQLAFEKAMEQRVDNAQNRVILLTDGAVNLGDANPESLSRMIETMRSSGIAFDAAGISAAGLNDEVLEALTRKGDGRYYLLDSAEAADEGFARQIAGALRPSAKNVKVQVEFNPKRVGRYKLLGFEKHRLNKEDFRNDAVDAAEMTAAEAGVAIYQFEAKPDGEGDVGSVSVRFRDLETGQMIENRWPIPYDAEAPRLDQAAPSMRIATSAALLAAKLRGEALGETVDLKSLFELLSDLPQQSRSIDRVGQLLQMISQARQITGN